MNKKMTDFKIRLLELLNMEYELLDNNPSEDDRLCIYTRIELIAKLLNETYSNKK